MNKLILVLAVAFALCAGCGYKSPYNYYPQEKVIQYGKVGEVQTVRTGDSILHYQVETETEVLNVMQNLTKGSSMIPRGIYEKTGEDDKKMYFADHSIKGAVPQPGAPVPATGLVYFKDAHKITIMLSGDYLLWSWDGGFKIEKTRLKKAGDDYSMRSLAYAGCKGNLVSFEYKEGGNSHRITHNMSSGNIFRYSGAEIEIIRHDNDSLTCRVIKEFDIFR